MRGPHLLFACAILICNQLSAQWQKTNGPTSGNCIEFLKIKNYSFLNGTAGGVFRSSDNGMHWKSVNAGLPGNPLCTALATDSTNLYAAIMEYGLYVSKDLGESWQSVSPLLSNTTIYALKVIGSSIYAGYSNGGLYYSADSGSSWVYHGVNHQQIQKFEKIGNTLWIFADKPLTSTDNGATWKLSNLADQLSYISAVQKNGNTIYAGGYDVNYEPAVFISYDNALSWTRSTQTGLGNITSIYATGSEVFFSDPWSDIRYSNDNGITWVTKKFPVDYSAIYNFYKENGILYASTLHGFFASSDNGDTWSSRSNGLVNQIVKYMAIDNNGKIYATTNLGGIYRSDDKGMSWTAQTNGVDIFGLSPAGIYAYKNKIYTLNGRGVYESDDYGANWNSVLESDLFKDQSAWSLSGSGLRLAALTYQGLHTSNDGGQTWSFLARTAFPWAEPVICFIKGDTIIVGGAQGDLHISTNGGNHWEGSYGGGFITDISFIGSSLFVSSYYGGLVKSNDLGITWTIASGLPSPVLDIYSNDSLIFAGTGQGVYGSCDDGKIWFPLNTNLDNQNVYSMVSDSEYAYVGTYGSGVWRRPLSELIAPSGPNLPSAATIAQQCEKIEVSDYSGEHVEWYFNGVLLNKSDSIIYPDTPGKYWATLSNACNEITSNAVDFDTRKRLPAKPGLILDCEELKISNPTNEKISWYKNNIAIPDEHQPSLYLQDSSYYKVGIENNCGVTLSDSIYAGGKPDITIFNVITPNNDNLNDYYKVNENLIGAQFEIFNRWGQSVYKNNAYQNDWNASDIPSGIYFYNIYKKCYGTFKGTLTIISDQ